MDSVKMQSIFSFKIYFGILKMQRTFHVLERLQLLRAGARQV